MSFINVTAKSKVYIGAAFNSSVPQLSDYQAQSWTEITSVTDLGTWGAKAKEITTTTIADSYVRRMKGTIDSGTVALVVNRDPTDAGQAMARIAAAAVGGAALYLFKVELADAITPDGSNTVFYFQASVFSSENKFGNADQIVETTFSLGITGQILEVPAAAVVTFSPAAGALPGATHGTAYSESVAASGGVGTVSYALASGALPSGVTLNAATGALSGTPAAAGDFSFTIAATYTVAGVGTAAYTLHVA